MKRTIIGAAGSIGAPTAFYTALRNVVGEIKMIDPNAKLLKNHVMDMEQAVREKSDTRITAADYSDLGDCDILMITAAKPSSNVKSREEWMTGNLQLLSRIPYSYTHLQAHHTEADIVFRRLREKKKRTSF